jgi:hypothetical protein
MKKWIKSEGGPLICIEHSLVQHWQGVIGNSSHRDTDPAYTNDYERACSVSEYLGKIPLKDSYALVLGDMPLETLIWQPSNKFPRIVRIYYADPEVDVIKGLESIEILDFSDPAESLEVEVNSTPMIVFDSACPGNDVGEAYLSFELPQGTYSVITKPFSPDDRTSLLIHAFIPSDMAPIR